MGDLGDWEAREGLGGSVRRCVRGDTVGALKVARTSDPVLRARAARSLEVLRRLDHPNIARALDGGETADEVWIVTTFAEGPGASRWLAPPPLPPDAVASVVSQVAAALAHAHARGVAHRDLKPDHVRVAPDGRVTVIDFDVAWLEEATAVTFAGHPGTPAWAPPEWFDPAPMDAYAADVYALGVLAWELRHAAPAFPGLAGEALAARKRALPHLEIDGADALAEVVRAATARDPAARPSAAALADRLAAPLVAPPGGETVDLPVRPASTSQLGRYALVGVVGRGGTGVVYRARDPALGREVAVKRLHAIEPAAVHRFVREARTLAALDHPGIVQVFDAGEVEGEPYYAMELCESPDLRARLRAGPWEPARAARLAAAVGRALAYAHANGVVHRDVKPGNILVDDADVPRLVDFGLATSAQSAGLTRTGQILGTPAYMAPEQATGGPADPRTDVYGLGAVLYEALAGRAPFVGDHPAAILHAVLHGRPPPLPTTVPPDLARVVRRAMAREPEHRYPSAQAFVEDLERVLAGAPVLAPAEPRRARFVGLAVAVIAVAVVGLAVLTRRGPVEEDPELVAQLAALDATAASLVHEGDFAEATRLVEAFANLPEVAGQGTAVRAWLAHAERLGAAGRAEEARTARGRGFAVAARPEDQLRALEALGADFQASGDLTGLIAVDAALRRRGVVDARLAPAARVAARRDLGGADDPELGALLRALSRGRPVPSVEASGESDVTTGDLDGDGRAELVYNDEVRPPRVWPGGAWGVGPGLGLPGFSGRYRTVRVLDGGPFGPLVTAYDAASRTLALARGGRRVLTLAMDPPCDAVAADLDGDGRPTVYVSVCTYQRDLLALVPDEAGERWSVVHPHPPSSDNNSDAVALGVLPRTRALAVAMSGWGAFDLRLLEVGPDDRHLRLRARRKIGEPISMAVLPDERLVVVKGTATSREVFPRERPVGDPPGLYVLGSELQPLWYRPQGPGRLAPGDFDGDGRTDLAVGAHGHLLLATEASNGDWRTTAVAGMEPLIAGEGDEDPEDELVAYLDGRLWILGAGEAPVPPFEAHVLGEVPAGGRTLLRERWARAEELLAMGLVDAARAGLEGLAALDAGGFGGLAWLRAAEIADGERDTAAALALYARAERAPATAAEAARRADELRRRTLVPSEPALEVVGAAGLAAGWDVVEPLQMRWDPDRGGIVAAVAGRGSVARLPLRRTGPIVGMSAELALLDGDFNGWLQISLAPVGHPEQAQAFLVHGRGGGGQVSTAAQVEQGGVVVLDVTRAQSGPVWAGDVVFESRASPDRRLSVVRSEGRAERRVEGAEPPLEGDWELTIGAPPVDRLGRVVEVAVRRLELDGLEVRDVAAAPGASARRALAVGDLGAADGFGDSPLAEVLAAVALDDLGNTASASARLRALGPRLADPSVEPSVTAILRGRSPRLVPAVREALGARWLAVFSRAWAGPVHFEPGAGATRDALLGQLGELTPNPDPEWKALCAEMETARGRVLSDTAGRGAGAAALARALACARGAGDTPDGRRLVSDVLLAQAQGAAAADPDAAIGWLREALSRAPAPEVFADRLAADPAFAPLRGRPEWDAIEAARMLAR